LIDACYQAGLRLLSYRARTEFEMRSRLARKGFTEAEIEATIAHLKTSGLIDDAAFAKSWSDHRTASSPRSAYVIKRELKTKGVEDGIADEAAAVIDDAEAGYRAALPRLRRFKSLPPEEAHRKLADFLRRRGFGWTVIERTLARLKEEGLADGFDTP
jgi:regulatory protein